MPGADFALVAKDCLRPSLLRCSIEPRRAADPDPQRPLFKFTSAASLCFQRMGIHVCDAATFQIPKFAPAIRTFSPAEGLASGMPLNRLDLSRVHEGLRRPTRRKQRSGGGIVPDANTPTACAIAPNPVECPQQSTWRLGGSLAP